LQTGTCLAVCRRDGVSPQQQEDYVECLHHVKEFTRLNKIEEHRRHAEARENGAGGH